MNDPLHITVDALLARLVPLVRQDEELLCTLRVAADEFLRLTASPVAASPVAALTTSKEAIAEVKPIVPDEPVAPPAPPAPPQHFALPSAPGIEIPISFRRLLNEENNLQLIETRARLKAEGARWAATRDRLLREGANYYTDIEPRDRDIIERARSIENCFLWMNNSSSPVPADLQTWEDVAGCFDAAAMIVVIVRQVIEKGDEYRGFLEKAIDLTAEAQSALRMAVDMVGAKPDSDQLGLFNWLRQMAVEQQVYIQRYMRLDDPADPTKWNDLQERIGRLDGEINAIRQRDKLRTKVLKQGQFHARIIREGKGKDHDWKKVIEAVEGLVAQGTPHSSTEFRDMLMPIADDLPDGVELSEGFQRVLKEVDRHLAAQTVPAPHFLREVSEEVRTAASLYKGKTLVLIGGDRRPNAYEALKSAFGLKELIWISTREHESTDYFIPYIARADVDAVLLAIRWSSHSYGDVKGICDKYGKEFFRLPAGYNPNQVAHQLLQQKGKTAVAKDLAAAS